MRFPAAVVGAVRKAMGPDFPIMVKMNMTDGIKGGIEIEDAVAIAKRFEAMGASGLVPSCGFTSKTPFMMMRGNLPIIEFAGRRQELHAQVRPALLWQVHVSGVPLQ